MIFKHLQTFFKQKNRLHENHAEYSEKSDEEPAPDSESEESESEAPVEEIDQE